MERGPHSGMKGNSTDLPLLLCPQGSVMSCSRPCVCSHGTSVEESTWYGFDFYPNLFYNDWLGTTTLPYNPERIPIRYINRPWPSLCWKVRTKGWHLWLWGEGGVGLRPDHGYKRDARVARSLHVQGPKVRCE